MKNLNFQKHFLVTIPRYSLILFTILMAFSMTTYVGGTMNDPEAVGYSFSRNFFSDLGKITPGNLFSMALFTVALSICGISFVAFFYYTMRLFKDKGALNTLAKIGAGAGILGGLCFVGVGFTPHNILLDPHIFFVKLAFRSYLLTSIIFSIVMYKDSRFENRYAIGYLTFAFSNFIYVLILDFAPSPKISDFSLIFNVISQKIIALIFILSVFYQSTGNSKFLSQNPDN